MPVYYALVDATPGREKELEAALQGRNDLKGTVRVKEGSHDFLVAFDQPSFDTVDDFLQTHIRSLPGVLGVEVIRDFDDHSRGIREAADGLAG